ncbi:DNA glycosylase AlkZ-like family protein [Actinotalea sp.]|uniref:DNA glycosylase AlkZ-like family protein n=1 Tax=Actinotalea sp. TaxID=1872145 RepID=UPI003568054D
MGPTPLPLSRQEILAFRRSTQSLDKRLAWGAGALRRAAWAGLQDSMPRAALLSIHARVTGTGPAALDDPALVQVWGPRYSVFVVPAPDVAPFTLGRLPSSERGRRRAQEMARAVVAALDGRELPDRQVASAIGVGNAIRYATTTGRLLVRWDGARAPSLRAIDPPSVDPDEARRELARRHLHVHGPADAWSFARWAGVTAAEGRAALDGIARELLPVRTPVGDRLVLAADADLLRSPAADPSPARLLPSGDPFFLLQGAERELLVPDASQRARLWTPRVWPGAVLVGGEVVGTWRRAKGLVTVDPWRRLTPDERGSVEAEAASLPLPGLLSAPEVRWAAGASG